MSRVAPLSFIDPQLASPVDQPPEGKHWIHEIKYDGYRCQVVIEQGHTRVFTGNGYNWSDRYPSIIQAAANLRCQSAIIDGEAILPDGNGVADFDSLNSAMRWCPASIILYAFDLMHLDGADLRRESLAVRRSILKALIGRDEESHITSTPSSGSTSKRVSPAWWRRWAAHGLSRPVYIVAAKVTGVTRAIPQHHHPNAHAIIVSREGQTQVQETREAISEALVK